MTKIRAIVAEDEKPARTLLVRLLRQEPDVEVVAIASDGRQAVDLIRSESPDLVLMDIQMPVMNGLEVLREVTPEKMPCTIFVTAHDKFAIQAFEAHALDYLLKPFGDQRFRSALDHVRRHLASAQQQDLPTRMAGLLESGVNEREGHIERVVLKVAGKVVFQPVSEIDWIEAAGVYCRLHIGQKSHLHRSSIAQFVSKLDPKVFVRIHRSTIVNTNHIKELQPRGHGDYTVTLKNGTELILSRGCRANLEACLKQPL